MMEDNFLQYVIERLRTSILQAPDEEIPEQLSMSDSIVKPDAEKPAEA